MRKLYVLLLIGFLFGITANAQLTGTKNIPGDYATLAAAITDLNAQGVGAGGVTLNLLAANPQTAPASGYSITASGTAANQIIIQGNNNTITASAGLTAGSLNDAIFKLIGADYVTITGFTMQENAANTTTAAATNNMTEWGVALLYATTTNGAQNNTIQNNTISLNITYANSFGIYSNVRHSATDVITVADITAASGANSNNKVYNNSISNVNMGITFIGSATAANMDTGNDIGGSSAGTGNTITNWGGGAAASAFVSNVATSYCIYMNHQVSTNVSFNTLTSAVVNFSGTFLGIYVDYATTAPTGSFTNNVNSNTVTMTNSYASSTATQIQVIRHSSTGGANANATANVNNNTVLNCAITGSGTVAITLFGVLNTAALGTVNLNSNIILGTTSTATTGGIVGVTSQGAVVNTVNLNNNQCGNASGNFITFSAATSGAVNAVTCSAAAATANVSINNNDLRGVVFNVISTSGPIFISNSSASLSQNISNNTFTNLNVNTTGGVTFISNSVTVPAGGTQTISGNSIVTAFNKAGAGGTVTCMTSGASTVSATASITHTNNNFSNITVTGATTINGISNSDGLSSVATNKTITGNTFSNWTGGTSAITVISYLYFGGTSILSNNTITNISCQGSIIGINIGSSGNNANPLTVASNAITGLSSTGTGGSVTGIACSNTSAVININGNTINTCSSTGASSSVVGVSITGATTTSVYQNTINSLSGSGITSPLVRGISVSSGTTVNVYKNKIYDLSESAAISTTAGAINGLLFSGGTTVTAYNNIIGDLRTPAASLTDAIRGISVTSTTATATYNIYYNTVYLNATSTGTNFGTTGIFHTVSATATTAALNLRNNIIINNSSANGTGITVVYRRSGTSLTNYASTSNNNLLAVAAASNAYIFTDGTNNDVTLADYQTRVAPRDAASITELSTPFLSTSGASANFLHINPAVPSLAESGGANIATVTDDYDGDLRNTTTPDIGADEFAGSQPTACSGTPTSGTISGTNTICANQSTTLILSGFSNNTGINIQWKSSTTSGGPYNSITGATGSTYNTGALSAGIYYYVATVTCNNGGGNVTTTEYVVTVNGNPTITISPSASTICLGLSGVSLTASGGISYTWAPSTGLSATIGATVTANPVATTTYSVTGTNAAGCSTIGAVTVTVNNPPTISSVTATPPSVCLNGSSQLRATSVLSGVAPTSTYSLSNLTSQTYSTLSGAGITIVNTAAQLTPGFSSASQDDGGVLITLPFAFNYVGNSFTQMSMSTNGWVAAGNISTISSTFDHTPANLFNTNLPNNTIAAWFKDMGANFPIGTGSMRHGLIGTDVYAFQWDKAVGSGFGDGSAILISFQVNIYGPNSSDPGRIEIIYGPTVGAITFAASIGIEDAIGGTNHYINALDGTGTSTTTSTVWPGNGNGYRFDPIQPAYSWSPSTFLSATNIANPVASNMTSTTIYTVTATSNGCSSSGNVTVAVGTALSAAASVTPSATICSGTNITLNATATGGGAPYTYSWSDGVSVVSTAQSFSASPSTTTTYTVTITDNCSQVATGSVTVTVNLTPTVTVSPTSQTICSGTTLGLTATGASTYAWAPATGLNATTGSTVFTTPTSTTTYTVTGTAANGCPNSATAAITVNPAISLSLTPSSSTICSGSSVGLTALGSSSTGYNLTAIAYNPIATPGAGVTTLANAGTAVTPLTAGTLDDGRWDNITLPFSFTLYGTTYNAVNISTNGWIAMGTTNTVTQGYNVTLPNTAAPNATIHVITADLDERTTGTVEYFTTGTAPNRKFVVNYTNVGFFSGGGNATTQAILYENTDVIEVHTTSVTNTTTNKSEAVENAAGTVAAIVPNRNNTAVWTGLPDAYRFLSASFTYTWYPATGLSTTTGASATASPTTSTTYLVSTTDVGSGCTATATATVLVSQTPTPVITPSNPVICNGDIQQLTVTSNNTGASKTGSSGSISVAIPDNNTTGANNTIAISGIPAGAVITNMQVTFNTAHSYDGNLIFNLKAPNGNVLNLVNMEGGSGDNFTSTTISSAAGLPALSSGIAPFTAVFAPDGAMGIGPTSYVSNVINFAGLFSTPNGNWTLAIQDAAGADLGLLTSWSVTIYYYAPDNAVWSPTTDLYTNAAATIPYTGTNLSTVYAKPAAITSYTVAATTVCSTVTANVILNVNQPPAITGQPGNLSLCQGNTATFTVIATGAGLTYQWYQGATPLINGGNISGATGVTLTITNVAAANAGNYTVVITGTCNPSATSNIATLSVGTPPLISTQPQSQFVCAGNTITLTVASAGINTYQWRKNGTNLVNGGNISGATSAALTISNITATDAGNYDVIVSNGCGFSTTSSVAVISFSATDRWLGVANSNWSNPANWCNGIPTQTTDVVIPAGTTFAPIIAAVSELRNLQIDAGASLTVTASGLLNIYGSTLTVNGTFTTTAGSLAFLNTANLNVPTMTVSNVIMNGAGGITLTGSMSITTALTLTSGNITLGSNNLVMTGGTIGSAASHIVTNGTGIVTNNNVTVATVVFPVGPTATSYNPVQIANGQGLNYTVRVAAGVPATLANTARAINRTWTITASGSPAANVNLTFGYADADANASCTPTANMEIGYYNGTAWVITTPAGGVVPAGVATQRTASTTSRNFGTMVVANIGGILNVVTATPNLNSDIYSVKLMPTIVEQQAVLRVMSGRAMNVEWTITDIQGRVVMKFNRGVLAGQNDITLKLGHLANGTYQVAGYTDKGTTNVIKFVRL